jgi:hypothetical protein
LFWPDYVTVTLFDLGSPLVGEPHLVAVDGYIVFVPYNSAGAAGGIAPLAR